MSVTDWRDDAEYLADLIPRVHPNAFAHVSRESFQSQVTDVETMLKSRTQTQRVMSLVRLVALLGDGHSTLFPFQPATGFGMLPLQIYLFSDGWYVTSPSPAYTNTAGVRVLRIGSKSAEEAFTIVRPYIGADNEATLQDRASWYLLCPQVLQALGIIPDSHAAISRFWMRLGTNTDRRPALSLWQHTCTGAFNLYSFGSTSHRRRIFPFTDNGSGTTIGPIT